MSFYVLVVRSKLTTQTQPFRFESFGARIEITGNRQHMIDRCAAIAHDSLLGNINEIESEKVDRTIEINFDGTTYEMLCSGSEPARGEDEGVFFKYFDSIVRASVGEEARDFVFLHAGVVGWKGKAIVLPGDSYKGKSTLVAELVRAGAEYYSDDFALFNSEGLLYPFHRRLAMRRRDNFDPYHLTVEELAGKYGHEPIPAGLVLFTEYVKGSRFRPVRMTAGEGVLQLVSYALSMRQRSEFAFRVLNNIASRAIIISSRRGTAENFAKTLLNFVDNHAN